MKYIIFLTLALISVPSFGDIRVTYNGVTSVGDNLPATYTVTKLDGTTFSVEGRPPFATDKTLTRCFAGFAGVTQGTKWVSTTFRPKAGTTTGCTVSQEGEWTNAQHDVTDHASSQLITTTVDISTPVNLCRTKCTISIPVRLQVEQKNADGSHATHFIDGTSFHKLTVERDAMISLRFDPETISARPGGVARTTLVIEHDAGVPSPVEHVVTANGDLNMIIRNTDASIQNIYEDKVINLEKGKPVTVTTTSSRGTSSRHTIDFRLPKSAGTVGPSTYSVQFTSKFT
ncbi:hypothetical protein I5481_20985 [Citrobacter freundii]|nr:hypothetical protein [Citrobacter freundii]